MTTIHHEVFDLDNEVDEVVVGYMFSPGCQPHFGSWTYAGDPGYPPEVTIVSVKHGVTSHPMTLTERESDRMIEWLAENHKDREAV